MLEFKSKIKCVLVQDLKFFILKKKKKRKGMLCIRCWCFGNSWMEIFLMFNGKVDGC